MWLPCRRSPQERLDAVWNTYIWVENADAAAAKAREAGGSVVNEPFDVTDAGRMAVLADPEGAVFCVWQARKHKGARVVNEPGSLNFNVLSIRDPEAAKSFYAAVFGWTTLDLGAGEFWALPGVRRLPRDAHARNSPANRGAGRGRLRRRGRGDRPHRRR